MSITANDDETTFRKVLETFRLLLILDVLRRPGGLSEEPEPDPIPNSAVKLLSANGTMAQALGE